MKVEVGARILDRVRVPRELEVAHLGLEDDLGVLLALERLGRDGLEDVDGAVDTGLELGEGRLVVCEEDVLLFAEAGCHEFCGVGAGLDLVVEAVGRGDVSQGWALRGGGGWAGR